VHFTKREFLVTRRLGICRRADRVGKDGAKRKREVQLDRKGTPIVTIGSARGIMMRVVCEETFPEGDPSPCTFVGGNEGRVVRLYMEGTCTRLEEPNVSL
jgi:hypothetical protein